MKKGVVVDTSTMYLGYEGHKRPNDKFRKNNIIFFIL